MLGNADLLKHVDKAGKTKVIQALTEALKDKDPGIRIEAARSLATFGPEAESAIPALTTILKDPHLEARSTAASTLKGIQRK